MGFELAAQLVQEPKMARGVEFAKQGRIPSHRGNKTVEFDHQPMGAATPQESVINCRLTSSSRTDFAFDPLRFGRFRRGGRNT
jgi:hypothetical protein